MSSLPRVGTIAWERAGGPPLSLAQRVSLLAGAGTKVVSHFLRVGSAPLPAHSGWAGVERGAAICPSPSSG